MVTKPDERFTGADAIVAAPTGKGITVSNVSWDQEVNTTEVQQSGLKPTVAVTGLRYSGSFEYDGKQESVRKRLWNDDGTPVRTTLTVKEYDTDSDSTGRKYTFTNVIVTGMSRDVPSDDVASTTWDFVAEDMNVTELSSSSQ